jgi:hypothetical protein
MTEIKLSSGEQSPIIKRFNEINKDQFNHKEIIVERLLSEGAINPQEATILLKTIDINIIADKIEMSSGAKIVGGSDFEVTDFGKR